LPIDFLQNPDGRDYVDFLKIPLVFVELNNKKIYVGKMMESPLVDTNPNGLITLVPLMSGYRNDKDKVEFTNNYFDEEDFEIENLNKIEISFPIQSLVSIREFNIEAFKKFIDTGSTIVTFKK
jgi:hypothetical protein